MRISFAGGGTDLEDYYAAYGGMVVSAAIDKYFYAFVHPSDGEGVHIGSSDYRCFDRWLGEEKPIWDGDLRLPRAILHEYGVTQGLSVFLASEIPPGTGLGSSSAVAVTLIKAFSTLVGQRLSPADVAEAAYRIESGKLGRPCGKQDQYAAAYGGLNAINFEGHGVEVTPLSIDAEVRERLRERLLLFFLGSARNTSDIGRDQQRATREKEGRVMEALHYLRSAAQQTKEALEEGDLPRLGRILSDTWEHKKRLAGGITNTQIDEAYARAVAQGAVGGKVTGAGGGGFLLLYCEPEGREAVCAEMKRLGLYRMDFQFDMGGAKVLVNSVPHREYSELPLKAGADVYV
ncbi:MAG TPA: GHMP kinase [Dehalococcoidia bacterium]|nr:GHMP kinase [Dehalococcoidia bacterium]